MHRESPTRSKDPLMGYRWRILLAIQVAVATVSGAALAQTSAPPAERDLPRRSTPSVQKRSVPLPAIQQAPAVQTKRELGHFVVEEKPDSLRISYRERPVATFVFKDERIFRS